MSRLVQTPSSRLDFRLCGAVCASLKGSLWSHVHATQGPRRRFDVVVNVYGPVLGFSERTNHSPCGCVAPTEGYNFWEAHVRPLRWTQGGSATQAP